MGATNYYETAAAVLPVCVFALAVDLRWGADDSRRAAKGPPERSRALTRRHEIWRSVLNVIAGSGFLVGETSALQAVWSNGRATEIQKECVRVGLWLVVGSVGVVVIVRAAGPLLDLIPLPYAGSIAIRYGFLIVTILGIGVAVTSIRMQPIDDVDASATSNRDGTPRASSGAVQITSGQSGVTLPIYILNNDVKLGLSGQPKLEGTLKVQLVQPTSAFRSQKGIAASMSAAPREVPSKSTTLGGSPAASMDSAPKLAWTP